MEMSSLGPLLSPPHSPAIFTLLTRFFNYSVVSIRRSFLHLVAICVSLIVPVSGQM